MRSVRWEREQCTRYQAEAQSPARQRRFAEFVTASHVALRPVGEIVNGSFDPGPQKATGSPLDGRSRGRKL
jgi:hypothetical protein